MVLTRRQRRTLPNVNHNLENLPTDILAHIFSLVEPRRSILLRGDEVCRNFAEAVRLCLVSMRAFMSARGLKLTKKQDLMFAAGRLNKRRLANVMALSRNHCTWVDEGRVHFLYPHVSPLPMRAMLEPEEDASAPIPADGFCSVSASHFHTLALDAVGRVYSCGSGREGKLGHGDSSDCWLLRRIRALDGVRVVAVAAGRGHSLLLDEFGAAYSFGEGRHGRLGHGTTTRVRVPRRILVGTTATGNGQRTRFCAAAPASARSASTSSRSASSVSSASCTELGIV